MVSQNGFGEAGQTLEGYWYYLGSDGPDLFRLAPLGGPWWVFHYGNAPRVFDDLRAGQRNLITENFAGVWGQFKLNGNCLTGLSTSIEKRILGVPPRCPQYLWWDRSQACFSPNGLRDGELSVRSFKHEAPECVQNPNRPDDRRTKLRRYIGASLAPVAPGRYLHVTAVAAPQGYRALARIAWDYREIQRGVNQPMRVWIDSQLDNRSVPLGQSLPLTGQQDLKSERAGRMRLSVSLRTDQGRVLHVDQLVVDFPRIPGLN
ncbi:MAG TPA: hypothetical protein VJS66_01125 [Burkholderiales bacterium]|nr:hypothetical protein [Burkholderiales bacterium]